jgi:hypothetical protein
MADIVVGGPSHRSACERFKKRLDLLVDLRSVELAIEEINEEVWYLVICGDCDVLHPRPPFTSDHERMDWLTTHVDTTGHTRIVKFEEPR